MRIYLDNCVIQDLKKTELSSLLDSIKVDKENNIYCYSEAHLYDLMRDKSDNKFDDLKFIEEVADSNCLYYDKKIHFNQIKPKDFYDPFPEYSDILVDSEELFSKSMEIIFKKIPLDFKMFIEPNSMPSDFPLEMKKLLEKPTNFYEFFCAFGNFTNELSENQKEFKQLISYLHNNNLTESIFEQIGIVGYNGHEITNIEKFRDSYTKYFLKDKKEKYGYDLFLEQYNGLEFFSFVKGKPRKQKMMNLINDGRHAFFGGFCDIIVSKDVDFLEKTKFIYEVHDIQTLVLNVREFGEFVQTSNVESKLSIVDMLKDGNNINENIVRNENGVYSMKLSKTYFSYFNTVNFVEDENGNYNYYTRSIQNMSTFTLKDELKMVVFRMTEIFGADLNGNKDFDMSEVNEDNWVGRVWRINDTIIELNLNGILYMAFYPVEYLESTKIQQKL